jgi:hypothetical protein
MALLNRPFTAGFLYTPPGGAQRTVELEARLRDVIATHRQRRYTRTSLDYTVTETHTVGSGVYEIEGTIRYASNAQEVLDMLRHAANGAPLEYRPNLTQFGHPCVLVHAGDVVELEPDRQVGHWQKRYEVRVRLRKTNGSDWSGVIE